jgi:hypothetical protein
MALNRTDTRQRAYCTIAACNPSGNWIDEPSFNRHSVKGVLVGNWDEEQQLDHSMNAISHTRITKPIKKSPYEPKRGLFMHQAPNLQSSVYLTAFQVEGPAVGQTEMQASYLGTQNKKKISGVRQQLIADLFQDEIVQQVHVESQPFPSSEWQTHRNAVTSVLPVKYAMPLDPTITADAYLTLPQITSHTFSYKDKTSTGSTFNASDHPHKRNANFSTPIASYNKGPTPQY